MELDEFNPNAVKTSGYITSSTPITTGYDAAAGGVQYTFVPLVLHKLS
jgi:hypothetical protein